MGKDKKKLELLDITLNNSSGVFYAGSVVDGHAIVEVNAPWKIKGLPLNFVWFLN